MFTRVDIWNRWIKRHQQGRSQVAPQTCSKNHTQRRLLLSSLVSDGINNGEAEAFLLFEHLPPAIFFLTISSSLSGSAKHPKVGRKNEREGSPAPVHTYAHFRALETVDEEAKFKDTSLEAQKNPEQALVRALSRLTER